jgi:hypothetical protein
LGIYSFPDRYGRSIYLVDTPGFDDTWRTDADNLKEIVFFLAQIYRMNISLAGIVYLHPITGNRISGSTVKNFKMLNQLCGPEALKRVILLTTMWDSMEHGSDAYISGLGREEELIHTEDFWGSMCAQGSQVLRWFGEQTSALAALEVLLTEYDKEGSITVQIQRELVDERRDLWDTSAGREVADGLVQIQKAFRKELEDLKVSYKQAMFAKDQEAAREVALAQAEVEKELQQVREADKKLHSSLETLFADKMAHYSRRLDQAERETQAMTRRLEDKLARQSQLEEEVRENTALFCEAEKYYHDNYETRFSRATKKDMSNQEMRRRLREEWAAFVKQYEEKQSENERQKDILGKEIQESKRKILLKRNIIPILQVLGGVGAIAAGAATGVIPIAAAGIGLIGSAAGLFQFSSKDKK